MVDSYSAMSPPPRLPGVCAAQRLSPCHRRPVLPMSGEVGIGDFLKRNRHQVIPHSEQERTVPSSPSSHFRSASPEACCSASRDKGLVHGSAREMDATFLMADAETGDSCQPRLNPFTGQVQITVQSTFPSGGVGARRDCEDIGRKVT